MNSNDRIFPHNYDYYNKALRSAGEEAKLQKTITTHIMKHTFISQGHRHGLGRETIVEMTGTEDRTIKLYYLSLDEDKIRQETQGKERTEIPFYEWAESLHPYFEQKYQQLNGTPQLEQNIRWEPGVLFPVRVPQLNCN